MHKLIFFFGFLSISLFAQNIDLGKPVEFTPKNLSYFTDTSNALSFKDIQTKKFSPTKSIVYFGYTTASYWLKFTYEMDENALNEHQNYLLALKKPYIEHINLYYIKDGKVHRKHNGRHYSLHDEEYPYKEAVFYLPNARKQTIYIKLHSKDVIIFNANIYNEHQFLEIETNYHLFMGVYFGFLIVMILYNSSLYFKLKDIDYFWYTFFLFAIIVTTSTNFHYFDAYVYEFGTWMGDRVYIFSYIIATILIQKMVQSFLNTKQHVPKLHILFNLAIFLSIVPFMYTLFTSRPTILAAILYSMVPIVIANLTILKITFLHSRLAKYFAIAFFIFSIGAISIPLVFFGIIQNTFLTLHGYMFGTMFEVIILSLALSDKITQIQEENTRIQHELLIASENENIKLEKKVAQRTSQLAELVKDKEMLLKEVYHRVKNNFQMVTSILWIESNRFSDDESKSSYLSLINRMKSMALVHQFLYDSNTLSEIKTTEYIQKITDEMQKVYAQKNVIINTQVDEHILDMDSAMALGIIVNEVLNNAIKYHPNHYQCEIDLSFTHHPQEKQIVLVINDNGVGITEAQLERGKGLGIKLIRQFAGKLPDSLTSFSQNNGTRFILSFSFVELSSTTTVAKNL